LGFQRPVEGRYGWHLNSARFAPGCPEFQQDDLAPHVCEIDGFAVESAERQRGTGVPINSSRETCAASAKAIIRSKSNILKVAPSGRNLTLPRRQVPP
jgi:hypothetical protein